MWSLLQDFEESDRCLVAIFREKKSTFLVTAIRGSVQSRLRCKCCLHSNDGWYVWTIQAIPRQSVISQQWNCGLNYLYEIGVVVTRRVFQDHTLRASVRAAGCAFRRCRTWLRSAHDIAKQQLLSIWQFCVLSCAFPGVFEHGLHEPRKGTDTCFVIIRAARRTHS